jgi:hypothetical protein
MSRTDELSDGALMDGGSAKKLSGGAVKARLFRATVTAAMLAAVLQAFGAYIKW